ncbi:MAG TPA: hypothetical protein VK497_05035 [Candidatus Saccharimonadales bacterium]|nr:hypothetical protein [Candidatus Saccharimonadales bacterium]
MSKHLRRIILSLAMLSASLSANVIFQHQTASAAEGEFYLEVSPSPVVTTVKPGESKTIDFKVRNAGPQTEKLKIEPRSFKINNTTGEVQFDDTKPPEIASWIKFKASTFEVSPGQWYDQQLTIDVPKDAGFSYSFAMLIQRNDQPSKESGRSIKAQIGVFVLLNIDRPGATRKLEIESVSTDKGMYEYLPSTINVKIRNTGNTIAQPAGDIFLQRDSKDNNPIDILAVNKGGGYILPGTTRTFSVDWDNGFPVERTDGTDASKKVDWNWSNLSNIRVGHYTAKVVAIYNDGQRDIPITGEAGFWVIPWKILAGLLLFILLLVAGIWSLTSKILKFSRPKHRTTKIKRMKH